MSERRVATLTEINGTTFRLVLSDGSYADFERGILSIDDSHPMFDWLVEWATTRPSIRLFLDGELRQQGQLACDVCYQVVRNEEDLVVHTNLVHTETGEREEPVRPVRTPRRRG